MSRILNADGSDPEVKAIGNRLVTIDYALANLINQFRQFTANQNVNNGFTNFLIEKLADTAGLDIKLLVSEYQEKLEKANSVQSEQSQSDSSEVTKEKEEDAQDKA